MTHKYTVVAHGGAGNIDHLDRRRRGLITAVKAGAAILEHDGSSLDAVTKTAMLLEDNPVFNAGTGVVLNLAGEAEMDAAVMTSAGAFGAVAAVKEVRNPTLVARLVMEKTDHIMLGGEGAVRFARLMGLRRYDPRTKLRMNEWRRLKRARKSEFLPRLEAMKRIYCSTVGVVAIDRTGLISVATSTGGMPMRLPGRVGDTPMLGAGTYATAYGGVSATGHGEMIIKHLVAMQAVTLMKNRSALLAGRRTLESAARLSMYCGLVGVDARGHIVIAHNTPGMTWCYVKDGTMRVFRKSEINKGLYHDASA